MGKNIYFYKAENLIETFHCGSYYNGLEIQ